MLSKNSIWKRKFVPENMNFLSHHKNAKIPVKIIRK